MAEKWTAEGDWVNTCSCDSGCPCLFYSDPTKGYCDSMDAFHIRKGKYGDVRLDGLNVVLASHSPGNLWKGNWTTAAYFDEKANPKQKKALETIFNGKAGGAPAVLAGLIGTLKGARWVSIKFDPKNHWVQVPDILEYRLKSTEGGNKKKPIQVTNHPLSPDVDSMNMGLGTKSHFRDFGMEFDNTGKDGNWAPFHFKGP